MTESIVERLRAALDEDERVARAACHEGRGEWAQITVYPLPDGEGGLIEDERGEIVTLDGGTPSGQEAEHIVRHDPARVLRQVAAMRKILDEHDLQQKIGSTREGQELLYYCPGCGGRDWDLDSVGTKPCPTVLALAELYEIEVDTRRFAARRIWGQDGDGNNVVIGHTEPELVDEDEP